MAKKKGRDNISEELEAMLNGQASESGRAESRSKVEHGPGSLAENDLDFLLNAETSGSLGPNQAAKDSAGSESDLTELLRSDDHHTNSTRSTRPPLSKAGSEHQSGSELFEALHDHLLEPEQHTKIVQQASIEVRSDSELENLLGVNAPNITKRTTVKKRRGRLQQKRRAAAPVLQINRTIDRREKVALSLLFLFAISVVGYFVSQTSPAGPDKILYELADEVKRYEAETGRTPSALRRFDSFPADYVEWDIENWELRSAEALGEVFFIDEGIGFAIILRNSSGVWVYDSTKEKVIEES